MTVLYNEVYWHRRMVGRGYAGLISSRAWVAMRGDFGGFEMTVNPETYAKAHNEFHAGEEDRVFSVSEDSRFFQSEGD